MTTDVNGIRYLTDAFVQCYEGFELEFFFHLMQGLMNGLQSILGFRVGEIFRGKTGKTVKTGPKVTSNRYCQGVNTRIRSSYFVQFFSSQSEM